MTLTGPPGPHYSTLPVDREARLAPGTRVLGGHIEVVKELARGGMAVVYQAADHGRGGEAIALKVGIAGGDAREMAGRFHNEARLGASLGDHPNVVRPLWVGSLDGPAGFEGRPVLLMELVNGTPLDLVMLDHRKGLPTQRACALGRDVARALAELHRRGIVHRDVKPANVIVARSGETEHARLIDFGLAYATGDGWDARSPDLTAEGHAPGTALYMSPQQAAHVRPEPSFDVYALGVTLYELFSGSPPHDGYGLGELLARKCDPQGGPLSLALMCPGLPERLVALVHECLRYEASERPTAEDVARVLEGELGGGIGEAAVVGEGRRARRWPVAVAAVVVTALVVALARGWGEGEGEEIDSPRAVASTVEPSALTSTAYAQAPMDAGGREPVVVPKKAEIEAETPSRVVPERRVPGKVRRPDGERVVEAVVGPEIDPCPAEVDAAKHAGLRGQWAAVLRLTKKTKCWPGEAANERTRLRLRALFEAEHYAECAELGAGSGDPTLIRTTQLCKARTTGESGSP